MSSSWAFGYLDEDTRQACIAHAQSLLSTSKIEPLPQESQGGCSFTLRILSTDLESQPRQLLQFRPTKYSLAVSITDDAKLIYGEYAPFVRCLGHLLLGDLGRIDVFLIDIIEGISYADVRPNFRHLDNSLVSRQMRYITGFADFLARGWRHGKGAEQLMSCNGKVGRQLKRKIERLTLELPTYELRSIACRILEHLPMLDKLPVVLCHGDMIPSNIIIHDSTSSIQGFLDWAEAEYLPFGIPLYGLEHFLGYLSASRGSSTFTHYSCEAELRSRFWKELEDRIPELIGSIILEEATLLARDVGVLLWYGYAWDDGAIDRVVNARDDPSEVMYLETFLGASREETSTSSPTLCKI
ncbi:hypothetical protein NA57DRAFT_49754 [Rhizodiscina lignyota]|uniref:Aminoglycoside phosphotransferase domain-containing protein n=1 Tax=Rhizodiscina lignyota TaxID=1504668 RepID=A0A9P4M4C3_9PEZI|nr:hypothetical protein NA57DRAFT_49754 [Rhizodiscina lignyota]